MPWKSGTIMDSRLEFVRLAEQGGVSVAELCRRFGISRETGFQYLRRYRESGVDGLKDRSSRPLNSPNRCACFGEKGIPISRAILRESSDVAISPA